MFRITHFLIGFSKMTIGLKHFKQEWQISRLVFPQSKATPSLAFASTVLSANALCELGPSGED